MKKRYIFATATMMMGSAIFIELKTGWLFGTESSAAEARFARVAAAVASAPAPAGAGRAPFRAVASDDRVAPARPAAEPEDEAEEAADAGDAPASSAQVAAGMAGSGFDQQLPGPQWFAGSSAGGWMASPFEGDIGPSGFGGGSSAAFAGGINPDEAILRSAGTNLISTVPEPETWISLIAGLFLVAINMRRRRALPSVAS